MKDLNYQLKALCRNNRDGSHATREIRERLLSQMANQLLVLGYRRLQPRSLKPKHVEALVSLWKGQGLGIGTLKNRLAVLRWWAAKVNRANVVARDNGAYGIGERHYVAKTSKARDLDPGKLARIKDPYLRLSLRLQAEFGLRREEAIKFSPSYAVRQDHICLKASWTKGGRERSVPIIRESQRALLEEIHRFVGGGALIPPDRNYVQQLRCYESQTKAAELKKLHGLRHAYAQRRYRELTGWPAPVAGGPARKVLGPVERAIDEEARATVTAELGHTRLNITNSYLGR
ncbi:phage integrase N-terminal domain-containing protein [Lentisalinibacter salinarum]|uniref:phage integrase N-terminal domain-containing protein n=1 Tax=Lentisalinibacter salinarum TaxID=2992239 RepID=UPI00387079CA